MESRDSLLQQVYSANDRATLDSAYSDWATTYDRDVMVMGYQAPAMVAATLARHCKTDGPVLDCGAGTGLVGLLLAGLGYDDVTALDMSEAMLGVAQSRGCYRECVTGVLGETLPLADGRFAAIVAAGVYTMGHAPADSLDEIVRILAPGGHYIVSERVDEDANRAYAEKRAKLEAQGRWALVDMSPEVATFPLSADEAHVRLQVFTYRRSQ